MPLIYPWIIAAWMLGGQFGSAFRKYGIMTALIALVIWRSLHGGIWWHYLPLLGVCPELFLGYGTGSWVAKHFEQEWQIRFVYAVMLWIPIAFTGLLNGHPTGAAVADILLIGAFQIHAGSFKIGRKDFLWEDFIRSLAVSIAINLVI